MNELTKEEKIKLIRDLCDSEEITAYEIGQATGLDTTGIHRILKGETENPRNKTLNKILDFLEKRQVGRNYHKAEEPKENYGVLAAIEDLKEMINAHHTVFSDALKVSLLDTAEIKNISKEIKADTSQINRAVQSLAALVESRLNQTVSKTT